MLFDYDYFRNYIFGALDNGPWLMRKELVGLTDAEADYRGDPVRFTIREVVAHLADWEPIHLHRMKRIFAEDRPTIHGIDEGELAVQNDYAHSDVSAEIDKFEKGRAELAAFLKTLPPAAFGRTAVRKEIGEFTLIELALFIPLHDSYHLRQVRELRDAFK